MFDAMAAPTGTNMDTQETQQQVEVWWIMDLEVYLQWHVFIYLKYKQIIFIVYAKNDH